MQTLTRAAVCATLVGLLSSVPAWADNIDNELLVQAPKLIKILQERGYKSVGVLPFMFQRGKQPSQFRGVTICSNMPQRVENALALKMSSKQPEMILVERVAGVAAQSLSQVSYRTPEDRQRLFKVSYPKAWGGQDKLIPDSFLVGKVQLAEDLRRAVVSLAVFDRERFDDILEFSVATDRYILADAGQGFSLTKAHVRGVTDDVIIETVQNDVSKTDTAPASVSSAGFPVKLTVYYDNEPVTMSDDKDAPGSSNFALPEPKEGQSLTFGMINQTSKPVGVVLMVNGISTLYEQEGEPAELSKWVLEPGKEYRIKGYHQQDGKYFAITTLSENQSKENYENLGGAKTAGLIHMYCFTPVEGDLAAAPSFTRSIGRFSRKDNSTFASLAELQQSIARKSTLFPPGTRPLAGWGKESNESLDEKKMGPARLTDTMVVRYSQFKPE